LCKRSVGPNAGKVSVFHGPFQADAGTPSLAESHCGCGRDPEPVRDRAHRLAPDNGRRDPLPQVHCEQDARAREAGQVDAC
jgi:hypothetical protein